MHPSIPQTPGDGEEKPLSDVSTLISSLSRKRKFGQTVSAEGNLDSENSRLLALLTDLQRSGLKAWSDNRLRPSELILTGFLTSGEFKSRPNEVGYS